MKSTHPLSHYIDLSESDVFKQIGYNDFYDKVYREIAEYFIFSVKLHVESLKLPTLEEEHLNDPAYLLPIGIVKEIAEMIDEKIPEASILVRSSILYEILKVINQRSIIIFSLRTLGH